MHEVTIILHRRKLGEAPYSRAFVEAAVKSVFEGTETVILDGRSTSMFGTECTVLIGAWARDERLKFKLIQALPDAKVL